jgi:hypothetical protein
MGVNNRFEVYVSLIFLQIFSLMLNAQSDSTKLIKYSYNFLFQEGIYPDFNSFRNNSPILFESLTYPIPLSQSFYAELDTVKYISYNDQYGLSINLKSDEIWGYCKNGKPYINWAGKYNLIPFVGSITHFITTVKVVYSSYHDPFYDPYNYNRMSRTYQGEELRQFVIDMETGKIMDYNIKNIESIFQREPEIYADFNKLGKRKKTKQLFYFVRTYNEKRSLLIPIFDQ